MARPIARSIARPIAKPTAAVAAGFGVGSGGGSSVTSPLYATAIGDSIDEGWTQSFFGRLCLLSEQRLRFYDNAGIGGNNTTQMLARIQTDVIDIVQRPVVCILGSTTNDYPSNIPVATTRSNITTMISMLQAAGIRPILRATAPTDNAGTGIYNTVALRRQATIASNEWAQQLASDMGLEYLDVFTPIATAEGGYVPGTTTDGTHPTPAATDMVSGLLAANPPFSIGAAPPITLVNSATEPNLFPGGFITTTTGWGLTGAPVVSLDTAYPGGGDAFRMDITAVNQLAQRSIMSATVTPLIGKYLELAIAYYGQGCSVTLRAQPRNVSNVVLSTHFLTFELAMVAGRLYKGRISFPIVPTASNILFTVASAGTISPGAFIAFAQVTGRESLVGPNT